jgi:TM2 domain-containing membrane protein YozV
MSNNILKLKADLKYKDKEVGVAYMFFFLIGIFGAHRFYLGQWIQGILFSTAFFVASGISISLFFKDIDSALIVLTGILLISFLESILIPSNCRKINRKLIKKREKFIKENQN